MLLLDGKLVSQVRREALKPKVAEFMKRTGRKPHLVVVLVGEDPASQVYVRNKIKSCEAVGILSTHKKLPTTATQAELDQVIEELNQDPTVDGILVQLPLPGHLSEIRVNELISADKDVDGFTFQVLGHLWAGSPIVAPCTPKGIMSILEHYQIPVAGKRAVVIGRSNIVGKPMAHLLTMADATVTLCHSKTKNLRDFTSQADIVVVAAGRRHLLGREDFKAGAVIIDVGIHGTGQDQPLVGDVRFHEIEGWASAATPVPGGVGPMTITTLLENTLYLAERKNGLV
ncbi:MAG: bifunctional protein FolD [Oligoflexia bacterium]|nr:MAG: bifunctional protein FolD [Oligoflexia bacterium]